MFGLTLLTEEEKEISEAVAFTTFLQQQKVGM